MDTFESERNDTHLRSSIWYLLFCFFLLFYVHILLYFLRVVGELSRLNRQHNISKILQLHASIVVLQNQISQLPCGIHNSTSNAKKLLTIEKYEREEDDVTKGFPFQKNIICNLSIIQSFVSVLISYFDGYIGKLWA